MSPRKTSAKALKVEDKQLRDYELVLIINPEVAEEKSEATIDGVSQFISAQGGVVADVDRWGKRKLAYPIKQCMEGKYVLMHCRLKPVISRGLEANLRISEEVLRHMLVRSE